VVQTRNVGYPRGTDEDHVQQEELTNDERFAGCGGPPLDER
jgi:hypothetical protein